MLVHESAIADQDSKSVLLVADLPCDLPGVPSCLGLKQRKVLIVTSAFRMGQAMCIEALHEAQGDWSYGHGPWPCVKSNLMRLVRVASQAQISEYRQAFAVVLPNSRHCCSKTADSGFSTRSQDHCQCTLVLSSQYSLGTLLKPRTDTGSDLGSTVKHLQKLSARTNYD